jgi:hypothetical protein
MDWLRIFNTALKVGGAMAVLGFVGGGTAAVAKETARKHRRRAIEMRLQPRVSNHAVFLTTFVTFADVRRAAMDTLQRLGRRVESLLYFDEMVTMAEPQHVKLSAITEATQAAANIRQLLRDYYIQSGIATRHVSAYEIAPVNRELAWAQETFLALVNQYVTHISNMALHKANCHAHLIEHK